jgi:hypothetical protein
MEVPLGVHEQDVGTFAGDLAAQDERRRAVGPGGGQSLAMLVGHRAAEPADVERGIAKVAEGGQALAVEIGQVLVDAVDHLLGRRQVSG